MKRIAFYLWITFFCALTFSAQAQKKKFWVPEMEAQVFIDYLRAQELDKAFNSINEDIFTKYSEEDFRNVLEHFSSILSQSGAVNQYDKQHMLTGELGIADYFHFFYEVEDFEDGTLYMRLTLYNRSGQHPGIVGMSLKYDKDDL